MTPQSTADYYRRQQALIVTLLTALRRTWRRMDAEAKWEEQFRDDKVADQLLMLVLAAQVAATRDADAYIAAVLGELDLVPAATPGVVSPQAFTGLAGDGRSVSGLLDLAVPITGRRFNQLRRDVEDLSVNQLTKPDQMSDLAWESLQRERQATRATARAVDLDRLAREALTDTEQWIETVAATIMIDTARAAETVAITSYPEVEGWVRMLNPPSCSRCVVLAGKFYRWNEGFERHPLCDCRHIPASEATAGDIRINPDAYFHSLSRKDQDKIFTQAGAEAIRNGADIGQVVNARRGMQTAQVGGRDILVSLEGTTKRGLANRRKTGRNATARLMPETINEIAVDRDDALRLYRLNGYLVQNSSDDRPSVPGDAPEPDTGRDAPETQAGDGGSDDIPPARPVAGQFEEEPDPEILRAAEDLLERVELQDLDITADVLAAAALVVGSQVPRDRLETRWKHPWSIGRKLADLVAAGLTLSEAMDEINDALRFTVLLPDVRHWARGSALLAALRQQGFEVLSDPAGWRRVGYKGRNITLRRNGLKFEIQIHTAASLQASVDTHELYEELRRSSTPAARKAELRVLIAAIYATVPHPGDVPLTG